MNEPQLYDFGKPSRLTAEVEQRVHTWLRGTAALSVKKAVKHVPFPLEATFQGLEVARSGDGLGNIPDTSAGYGISFNSETPALLVAMPRPLLLAIIGSMLGDAGTALPEDRELTAVESELAQFFIQDVLVASLQETWPSAKSIPFKLRRREPHPKWTRIFAPEDNTVVGTIAVKGPFGDSNLTVLVSFKHLQEQIALGLPGAEKAHSSHESLPPPQKLRLLAEELPIDVTVLLGTVELTLAEVARLDVGDVILLGQRVSEPLQGLVSGARMFRAWPGRVGSRQAVEIETFGS